MASEAMENLKVIMQKMMAAGMAPKFGGDMDPMALREVVGKAQMNMQVWPNVEFLPRQFGAMDAEISMPENADESAIIMYIHGGGLIVGNALSSRGYASMLAHESHHPVYSFSYRLAPEDPYPAAVEDCFEAYKAIEAENPDKPIFLIGESGGAYLCITTAILAMDAGMRLPGGVIPYSPPIDFSNEVIKRDDSMDFTVNQAGLSFLAELYCPGADVKDKLVSPVYADYTGFPPTLLAWDKTETLAADSDWLVKTLTESGVDVTYKSYDDCFHAFATTGRGTPESSEIMDDTIAFIDRIAEGYKK